MRILYFSGSTLPSTYANAVHVMKMCAAFAGLGHEVTLYAKKGSVATDDLFSYYHVPESFDVVLSPDLRLGGFSGLVRSLYTLIRRKPADLIYGRDLWTMAFAATLGFPVAFELHEILHSALQNWLLCRILRARSLKGLVVISAGLKADLLEFCPDFPLEKVLIAPDGADFPKESIVPVALEPLAGTDLQVGYGGSLYPGKGVELLLEIAHADPRIGVHVFGGPEATRARWLAQSPPSNIRFYGHLPHGQLAGRLAACQVLLAPYLPAIRIGTGVDIGRWISPLKLFEYMALQRPIVCSDLPVLREVMAHEGNCLMADPARVEDWAGAIRRLDQDSALASRLSSKAYEQLETQYSWEKRADKILTFLDSH